MKKIIAADEFQTLGLKEKSTLIFAFGEELFCRKEKEITVKIFILSDFYVEIYYESYNNKIKQIEAITDHYLNENYLSEVDISDLYN